MRRRAAVGLAGGTAAAVGIAIYAVNFAVLLPAWWTLLAASDASLAFVVATAAALPVARAGAVASSAAGEAGDLAVVFVAAFAGLRRGLGLTRS